MSIHPYHSALHTKWLGVPILVGVEESGKEMGLNDPPIWGDSEVNFKFADVLVAN